MRAPSPPPVPRDASRPIPLGAWALALGSAMALALAPAAVATTVAGAEPAAPATKVYTVPSNSMEPTITVGRRILVTLFPRSESLRPAVGAIVVTHPPRGADPLSSGLPAGTKECAVAGATRRGMPCPRSTGGRWADEVFVERIVAGPGDTIAVRDGLVIRNGVPVEEPYVKPTCAGAGEPGPCTLPRAIRLPPNRYFLMGDNRGESNDSRFWGPVPRSWMIGQVTQIGVPDPGLFR